MPALLLPHELRPSTHQICSLGRETYRYHQNLNCQPMMVIIRRPIQIYLTIPW